MELNLSDWHNIYNGETSYEEEMHRQLLDPSDCSTHVKIFTHCGDRQENQLRTVLKFFARVITVSCRK